MFNFFSNFRPACLSPSINQTSFPRDIAGGTILSQLLLEIPCIEKIRDSCKAQFLLFEKEKGLDSLLVPTPDSLWSTNGIVCGRLDVRRMIPEQYYDLLIGHRLTLAVPSVKYVSRIDRIARFVEKGKRARDSGTRARCDNKY
jgi:hypothetical protein